MTLITVVDPISSMNEEMQQFALNTALYSLVKFANDRKQMAKYIKNEFDEKYGLTWGCIISDDCNAIISDRYNCFTVFRILNHKIILFRHC